MTLTLDTPALAPTTRRDRYVVMDVLRGFALLGVMTINLYEFGGEDVLITAEQLAALPSAALDGRLEFWLKLFVYDKANTLFAFLFGLGFWIQMERLQARGAPFESIYLRRAAILLILGCIHLLCMFGWDILHVYGIAAFILFACRKLPDRALLWLGLTLLLFARPFVTWAFESSGIKGLFDDPIAAQAGVLARQAAAQSGDFFTFIALMNKDYLIWFSQRRGACSAGFSMPLGVASSWSRRVHPRARRLGCTPRPPPDRRRLYLRNRDPVPWPVAELAVATVRTGRPDGADQLPDPKRCDHPDPDFRRAGPRSGRQNRDLDLPAPGGRLLRRPDRRQLVLDEDLRLRPGRMALARTDLWNTTAIATSSRNPTHMTKEHTQ